LQRDTIRRADTVGKVDKENSGSQKKSEKPLKTVGDKWGKDQGEGKRVI